MDDKAIGNYIKKVFQNDKLVDVSYVNKQYMDEIENNKLFFIDLRNDSAFRLLSSDLYKKDGLHKIYLENNTVAQYIVFNGNLYSLMYSLAGLFNHGTQDGLYKQESLKKTTNIIRKREMNFTCGSVVRYCIDVFNFLGIETTYFTFKNNAAVLGSSHKMLEIYVDGEPVLCDLDVGSLFKKKNKFLSFKSLIQTDFNDEIEIINLNSLKRHTFFGSYEHNEIFYSEKGKRQFYKEVFSSKEITFGLRMITGKMWLLQYDRKSSDKMKTDAMKALLGLVKSGVIDDEIARAAFKRVRQQATAS